MKEIIKTEAGYSISEGNYIWHLSNEELIKFIKEEGINFTYLNNPDDLTEVCPINLLADNYQNIINLYLESHAV